MKYVHRYSLIIACLIPAACNDFLDVSSKEKILQKDIFSNFDGIRMATNGVYKKLSTPNLYGENLSWGFISALGHNYEVSKKTLPPRLFYAANFAWQYSSVENICDDIWSDAYNTIANINNLIQEVVKKDTSFFKEKELEKNMILGEMLGIRAFLHFDIFRLFVPAPQSGQKGILIPYVKNYPTQHPEHIPAREFLQAVIEDMNKSKEILAPIDTVKFRRILSSSNARIRQASSWINIKEGDFFNYRCERMNFFAATALLARIYMYMGDYENAYNHAAIIYNFHKRNWFKWTPAMYQGQYNNIDNIHIKRPEEILLTFANNKSFDNFERYTNSGPEGIYMFRMKEMDILFGNDKDDFRYTGWYNRFGLKRYLTWLRPRGNSTTVNNIISNQGPLLPVIRISEIYHILIECHIRKNNMSQAIALFNDLRLARGAKEKIASDISPDNLMDKLVNDIIRETLTEGQTFFMYKRLNRNIFNGETDIMMEARNWTLPIPYSETAF